MKNNTIEILTEGENHIPAGTIVTIIENGGYKAKYKARANEIIYITPATQHLYQVDFKDVQPLYPHKGMKVPVEGIEFADGKGLVRDIGEYGFVWCDDFTENEYAEYSKSEYRDFELKRTRPKTVTVCKDCYKEVCECVHEDGWYRVKTSDAMSPGQWILRHWNGSYFADGEHSLHTIDECVYEDIDWKHPINVIPEEYRW